MESFNIENEQAPDFKISVIEIFKKVVWTDIPILVTILFYLLLFLFAIKTRKNKKGRTIVFGICLLWTLSLDYTTKFLEKNWKQFGFSDNYFDEFGVFAAFFFALPPLFIAIFLLSTLIGNVADKFIIAYQYKKAQQNQAEKIQMNNKNEENNNTEEKENLSDGERKSDEEGKLND